MAYYSGMQPTNRKERTPFRPTDNSPFGRHLTLVDLLCILGGIIAQMETLVKREKEKSRFFSGFFLY